MIITKNKNFIVRTYQKNDAESIAKNANNRKIAKNLTDSFPHPYTIEAAKNWINKNQKLIRRKDPNQLSFAIEIDGEAAGGIGFSNIEKNHKAMLGYWLGEKYWGRGVMTKVVKEMTKYGFNRLKLKKISAEVFLFNKASMKVLEKAGYKKEGFLKKEEKKGEKYLDVYLYAKTK